MKLQLQEECAGAHADPLPRDAGDVAWPAYLRHLEQVGAWLLRSIHRNGEGSAAYFSPLTGWAAAYPETTGYLIPTLFRISGRLRSDDFARAARRLGDWLLGIQLSDGAWPGGLYQPSNRPGTASVFNTAQVIAGMVRLYQETGDDRWKIAAVRAGDWLANGVSSDGTWQDGNYRGGYNPSYYAQVAWPMLQACVLDGSAPRRAAAVRVLDAIVARRTPQGVIAGWGFDPGRPAFTHTIAYTLRGLMESAFLLDDWQSYGEPCVVALERLRRAAELRWGRLPGAYGEDWARIGWYSCLTGNAQVAMCLLRWRERDPDPRLLNAACKLVDYVASKQSRGPSRGMRGAIAGSSPPWGRYMTLRYPNWAAKYFADALCETLDQLQALAT